MKRNFALARELGLLRLPDHAVIEVSDAEHYHPGDVCVVSTGSQGENRSALAMAATATAAGSKSALTTPWCSVPAPYPATRLACPE